MAAVFTSAQNLKGAFRADLLKVRFGPIQSGMLAQNMRFDFTQAVSTLYEIGSNDVFLVGGRAQGTAGIQRVVGPSPLSVQFFQTFGNVCNAPNNSINFDATGGCGSASNSRLTYRLDGCVITSVGAGVNATDIVVNESVAMLYINLDRT